MGVEFQFMKIKHFALLLITSMLIVSILPVSVDAGSGFEVITYGAIKGETLFVGETRDCNEMIKYPEEYVPEWTNSDPSVLSLDNGIIQALKPGKADIDVTLDGESMLHYGVNSPM